jgi:dipeptidase
VRIPDDEVGVSANASRIRQIDLSRPDDYLASDNVFSLAEEMGWWRRDSGEPFEFCYAYADRNALYSRRREWRALSLMAPSLGLDPNAENYPLSVKPDEKLSVQDVLGVFRDYYDGTPFDLTRTLLTVDEAGKAVKSPIATPFMNKAQAELLKVTRERTIACSRATYVHVTQSRSWLPDPIGGVVWLGYDNPTTTPHIPFYCGISRMPDSYLVDGRRGFRRDSAWWAFRRVSKLANFRWQEMLADIENVWKPMEDEAFADQADFEKRALALYEKDPKLAEKLLTDHSVSLANQAVEAYWKLGDELWGKHNNKF